eukprot:SAG25_NODE_987_length_4404_cov_5.947735_6_plen_118_part_00
MRLTAVGEISRVAAHEVDGKCSSSLCRAIFGRRVPHQPMMEVNFSPLYGARNRIDLADSCFRRHHETVILIQLADSFNRIINILSWDTRATFSIAVGLIVAPSVAARYLVYYIGGQH